MRKIGLLTAVLLVAAAISPVVLAYESDRMDFGPIDFQGATVTYVAHFDNLSAFYEGGARAGRLEEAKKLFNIGDIQLITAGWDEVGQLALNRYLSGDSQYDIWRLPHRDFFTLATRGAFYPVDEILPPEYFEQLSPITREKNERLSYDGHVFHFSVGVPDDFGHAPFAVVNLDLFEREGLPDPYELYLAGEWTWDAVTDIAVAATRDLDGDGEIDQWGIVDVRQWDLAVSNGADLTRVDENGKVVFTADEPAYLEALEQHKLWWTDLKVAMPTNSSGDLKNAFINGKAALWFYAGAWQLPDLMDMADEWVLVPYPMGPRVDDYQWTTQALSTTVIPANAKDPEALIALKTFLWREEDAPVNDVLAAHVRNQESAKVFLEGNELWAGKTSRMFETLLNSTTYVDDVRSVSAGNLSPAAAMAALKPVVQAALDDLFDQ